MEKISRDTTLVYSGQRQIHREEVLFMRRIRYAVATSLDGFVAGPNGETDWIIMDPEIDFGALFKQFDTILLGRRTFQTMASAGSTMPGMQTFVFSRTLSQRDHPGVTIVAENPSEMLTALKESPGKDIWLFGGGALFRSLADLRLVDSVEVSVIPVLLGAGLPLFPGPSNRINLTLSGHKVYPKTGIVWLEYSLQSLFEAQARHNSTLFLFAARSRSQPDQLFFRGSTPDATTSYRYSTAKGVRNCSSAMLQTVREEISNHMQLVTPRFDNLQNELRRELDPKGTLEEEVFQSLAQAAVNRRRALQSDRYEHDRAFFRALQELRAIQTERAGLLRPVPPAAARRPNVSMFPSTHHAVAA